MGARLLIDCQHREIGRFGDVDVVATARTAILGVYHLAPSAPSNW